MKPNTTEIHRTYYVELPSSVLEDEEEEEEEEEENKNTTERETETERNKEKKKRHKQYTEYMSLCSVRRDQM